MAGEINVARYDANEILHKDDLQYGEIRAYENLTSIIKRLAISVKDVIIQGGIVKERGTPSMNVDVEALLAFCVSTGKFAYYGSDFGPVAITNGGAQVRYDLIEIRLKETNFDELQRAYKDPNTGDITYQDWMTKIHYEMEAQIIQGVEGAGVASSHTAGWIKIAEIFVDAGESTSILNADIKNATAGYDTETNSTWTAETDVTFRSKAITEIKTILRVKHKEDGDHVDDVIRGAHVDWGAGAGEVDADLMPLGTTITHAPTGGTAASLTSASTVRQAVQKILDLLIDLSGVQNDAVLSRHINADAVVNEHIGPAAVRETEIDLGVDAGDVDADVLPLGTAVTSSPTGGTNTNLANSSFVRAALQEAFNRLRDLSGVENGAIDSRHIGNDQVDSQHYVADSIDDEHINWGTGADQVSAADLPIADAKGKYTSGDIEGALGEVQATKLSAKAADYTITDTDGVGVVNMTTGAADKIATLPTAADNTDREITLRKADGGIGKAILDGEGAETINGTATWEITEQYGYVRVKSDGTSWIVLSQEGCIYKLEHSASHNQTSPVLNTWYNVGGDSISVPAGVFELSYQLRVKALTLTGVPSLEITLSKTSSSKDDEYLSASAIANENGATYNSYTAHISRRVIVASLSTYYLNVRVAMNGTAGQIWIDSEIGHYIRAIRVG